MNNKEITDPSAICQEFNNFFCSIGDSLVDKLANVNSCQTSFIDYCSPSVLNSMICNDVDQYELLSLALLIALNHQDPIILVQN